MLFETKSLFGRVLYIENEGGFGGRVGFASEEQGQSVFG